MSLTGLNTPNTTTGLYAGLILNTVDMTNRERLASDTASYPEASYTGYARVALAPANWTIAADLADNRTTATYNNAGNAPIVFPTIGSTITAGQVVQYLGLFTAATGGNLVWYTTLSSNKTLSAGDTPMFNSGTIVFTLD